MFWTREIDSFNGFYELTVERRCKDPWLSHVLKGARHGCMDEETYCFLHGFPTEHPGSWDPPNHHVACGNEVCKNLLRLWKEEIYDGKLGHAHWLRRRSQECSLCAAERKRRCCVLDSSDLSRDLEKETRFAAAPYIHAFNEPKYHASQIRALRFGMQQQSVVMWLFAEDRPLNKNTDLLHD